MDRSAAEAAIFQFLKALGHDPTQDPELAQTPARVVEAFASELLAGYGVDLAALVRDGSTEARTSESGLVALRDIDVATVCPHHLMPGLGRANVVYKPGARVLGLGAIARVVDACSRRLALQETIAEDVVTAFLEHAGARGAYCEITLVHGCLSARGACQASARATSIARRGALDTAEVALALGQPR
ncbi:MAG TPA: GTP cyclohydrolase I [Polyangiaceae bacterium]|nr:GTP cyclohydrolase I [Polyangiaceae bacterium]